MSSEQEKLSVDAFIDKANSSPSYRQDIVVYGVFLLALVAIMQWGRDALPGGPAIIFFMVGERIGRSNGKRGVLENLKMSFGGSR